MEEKYWLNRWQEEKIGFHQEDPNKHLVDFFPQLDLKPRSSVFVPLCGKSLDMKWLADQKMQVIGVELSELAIKAFFEENNISYAIRTEEKFNIYQSEKIRIYHGDLFDFNYPEKFDAIYDRASIVALPKSMRKKYAKKLKTLSCEKTRYLTISFTFDNHEEGPPFCVPEDEITKLFPHLKKIKSIDAKNMPPHYEDFNVKLDVYLN